MFSVLITSCITFIIDTLFYRLIFIFGIEENQIHLINTEYYSHTAIFIICFIVKLLFNYTSNIIYHLPIVLNYFF